MSSPWCHHTPTPAHSRHTARYLLTHTEPQQTRPDTASPATRPITPYPHRAAADETGLRQPRYPAGHTIPTQSRSRRDRTLPAMLPGRSHHTNTERQQTRPDSASAATRPISPYQYRAAADETGLRQPRYPADLTIPTQSRSRRDRTLPAPLPGRSHHTSSQSGSRRDRTLPAPLPGRSHHTNTERQQTRPDSASPATRPITPYQHRAAADETGLCQPRYPAGHTIPTQSGSRRDRTLTAPLPGRRGISPGQTASNSQTHRNGQANTARHPVKHIAPPVKHSAFQTHTRRGAAPQSLAVGQPEVHVIPRTTRLSPSPGPVPRQRQWQSSAV